MFKKIEISTAFVLLLLFAVTPTAWAWPESAPTKAFISGPGLMDQVQITDSAVLDALRLGALEDFGKGAIPSPAVGGEPYKIVRYFDNGTFRFGDLSFYPNADGASIVYFQDGPMIEGDQTPYNNKWFSTIVSSDQVLQKFVRAASANAAQNVWLVRDGTPTRERIGFDVAASSARFVLPSGIRSADGSAYWAAFQAGGTTALHSFDIANGSIRASVALDGAWQLGAVSATGRWLALKQSASAAEAATWNASNAWKTTIAIVDATTLKTSRTIALDGNYDVDALSPDGTGLYLIQHLPAVKPDHYEVHKYDLTLGQMLQGVIVDKRSIDEVMAGYPTDSVGAPDGSWLFTVYVGMQEKHAFIHALSLTDGYAWCIDLPSGDGDAATLEHYSLALAPDGHTIYASNAALGTLAIADVDNIGDPRVIKYAEPSAVTASGETPLRSSVVSKDGKFVYMSDGGNLWEYDVTANTTRQLKQGAMPILGLGFNADHSELLIAQADHSISQVALGSQGVNAQAASFAAGQDSSTCPVTRPSAGVFVPPSPYPSVAPYGGFWYGTDKLWLSLHPDGKWSQLREGDKMFWWSQGYAASAEPQPALNVTGRRLDGRAGGIVADAATNAYHIDFGGWAMLTGVQVPSAGCWEITGEYKGATLSFVVDVE